MVVCGTIKAFLKKRCRHRNAGYPHRWVRVSSPCEGSVVRKVPLCSKGTWHSFCPVCKRPIEAEPTAETPQELKLDIAPRYAYVVVLWGASPGYVLGAMVLAKSLRNVGTKHDLILMHTDSVPAAAVELLQMSGWKPRQIEPIDGVREMYSHAEPRFKGVFTKLRVLSLCEYSKVLCMDIDTLAIKNIDKLFDLQAPAANGRGPQDMYKHGDLIEGSHFFRGSLVGHRKSWGQCWGINAGVMLMEPSERELKQMLCEVLDPEHPSHVKGNGPEQDYLSRYWASCWTHISVEYNFQLHQMYHVLHGRQDARPRLMRQFLHDPNSTDIHLIHYSGSLKPWDRYLDAEFSSRPRSEANARFLRSTLESFKGYWLWALRDPQTVECCGEGVALGPTGKLHWIFDSDNVRDNQESVLQEPIAYATTSTSEQEMPLLLGKEVDIPEDLLKAAETIAGTSLTWWRESYEALASELNVSSEELARRVSRACPSECPSTYGTFSYGKRQTHDGWQSHGEWWVQHPVAERSTVLAGAFPQPFLTFTSSDCVLLDVRGIEAAGLFAVALSSNASVILRPGDDVHAWSAQVPHGAAVLVAVVNFPSSRSVALEALGAMEASGMQGLPSKPDVPANCRVLVLAGTKGASRSWEATAAADFARATLAVAEST